jgi:hypothetical protein
VRDIELPQQLTVRQLLEIVRTFYAAPVTASDLAERLDQPGEDAYLDNVRKNMKYGIHMTLADLLGKPEEFDGAVHYDGINYNYKRKLVLQLA